MNEITETLNLLKQQLEKLRTGGLSSRHLAKKRAELEQKVKELEEKLLLIS